MTLALRRCSAATLGLLTLIGALATQAQQQREAPQDVWRRERDLAKSELASQQPANLRSAEVHLARALREAVSFSPDDPRLLESLQLVAAVARGYESHQQPRLALKYLASVRKLAEVESAPNHAVALEAIFLVGDLQLRMGYPQGAEAAFEELRRRAQESLDPGHPRYLQSLIGLTRALANQRKLETARRVGELAVSRAEQSLGTEHRLYAEARMSLAYVRQLEDGFEQALEIYLAVNDGAAKSLGEYSLRRGELLSEIVQMYLNLYQYENARRFGEEALGLYTVAGVETHVALGGLYGQLSTVESRLDELNQAEAYARKELEIYRRISGEMSTQAALALLHLTEIAIDKGELASARRYLTQIIEIFGGLESPRAVSGGPVVRMAAVEGALGNHERAEELFALSVEASSARFGPDAVETGKHLIRYARYYAELGRYAEAEPLIEKAVRLVDKPSVFRGPLFVQGLHTRARVQAGLGNHKTARKLFDRALTDATEIFGEHGLRMISILEDALEAFQGFRHAKKRKQLQARLDDLRTRRAERLSGSESRQRSVSVEELNFQVTYPGTGWVEVDPEAAVPGAAIACFNSGRKTFFSVSGSVLSPDAPITPRGFAASYARRVAVGSPSLGVVAQQSLAIGDLDGYEVSLHAREGETDSLLLIWFAVHNGYFYRFAVWSTAPDPDPTQFGEFARSLFRGFEVLDPTRLAPGWQPADAEFVSPLFGYTVDLRGSDLWRATAAASGVSVAEFGASNTAGDSLAIATFSLLGTAPEKENIQRALFALTDLANPTLTREISQAPLKGIERDHRVQEGGDLLLYRARILHAEGRVYFLLASQISTEDDTSPQFSSLERVHFDAALDREIGIGDLDGAARWRHALLMNGLGLIEIERGRINGGLGFFRLAVELAPDDATIRENLVASLIRADRYAEAEAELDAAVDAFAGNGLFLTYRARARLGSGKQTAALEDYEAAFDLGHEDDTVLSEYASLLSSVGDIDKALNVLTARIDETNSAQLRQLRAELLFNAGNQDEAIAELEALTQMQPSNVEFKLKLATFYSTAGMAAEALKICDELISGSSSSVDAYSVQAKALYEMGRYREARDALETILTLDPKYPGARDFVESISPLIGEGSSALVRQPIDPVPAAAPLTPLSTIDTTFGEESRAYYERTSRAVYYRKGELRRTTSRATIKILDRRGVKLFSVLRYSFDPTLESIYVNEVIVRDSSGEITWRGDVSDYYVLDDSGSSMATSDKLLHIPIRGLAPGVTLESTVSQRELRNAERFRFERHRFSQFVPVAYSDMTVTGDVEALHYTASSGVRFQAREGTLSWSVEKPSPYRYEPFPTYPDEYLPGVCIADKGDTWEELGRAYLQDIQSALQPAPESASLAAEVVGEMTDPDQVATALASHVQVSLRYEPIEFGVRAWQPNVVPQILRNKYGDCKDHALLLHQMLRSRGVASRLALVRVAGPIERQLPALTQFDHMVVLCKACEGERFVDTTDKSYPPGAKSPRSLGGGDVLVLDPETPYLTTIPAPAGDSDFVDGRRLVRVSQAGDAEVEETIVFHGHEAAWIRDVFMALERSRWEEGFLRPTVAARSDVDFALVEARHLDDNSRPVELRLRYAIKGLFSPSRDTLVGRVPALWEVLFIEAEPADPRRTPFRLAHPLRLTSQVTLQGPAGYRFADEAAATAGDGEGDFYSWALRANAAENELMLQYDVSRRTGHFAAEVYAEFAKESSAALSFFRRDLTFERHP